MEFRIGIFGTHPVRMISEANVTTGSGSRRENNGILANAINETLQEWRPWGLNAGEILFVERLEG